MFWSNTKKSATTNKGDAGEKAAGEYLEKKGFKILEFNFQNPKGRRLGEIDIVAKLGKELVFVEVKTRIGDRYLDTLPEGNITPQKLYKLSKIGQYYIKIKNLWATPYRFDAVSVWLDQDLKVAKIKHLDHIFI